MIDTSRPVRLRRAPEWVGRVTSVGPRLLTVEFDGGGVGRFPEDDLEPAPDTSARQDKSWPPGGLERK